MPGSSLSENDWRALDEAAKESDFVKSVLPPKSFVVGDTQIKILFNLEIVHTGDRKKVEQWVLETLARVKGITNQEVSTFIKFKPRIWFDGPVSVNLILRRKLKQNCLDN